MRIAATSITDYISKLPEMRREAFIKLYETIETNIPKGFKTCFSYGMPSFCIPHELYPQGYHVKPEEPLPFISLGNQKNFIGLYHMGIYAIPELEQWFKKEYSEYSKFKLDMGKSCIRLKRMEDIPYPLIARLTQKISAEEWITVYNASIKK